MTYNQNQHSTQIHMDKSNLFFFYTFWPCTDIFMATTVHKPVQQITTECSSSGLWCCVAGQMVNVMTSYSWLPVHAILLGLRNARIGRHYDPSECQESLPQLHSVTSSAKLPHETQIPNEVTNVHI